MSEFEEFSKAIKNANLEKVKTLFNKKFLNETIGGWTPLHLASVHDSTGTIAKYLLSEGFNIEDETLYGERCIHIAAERGLGDVVEFLINEGCQIDSVTKEGQTPLDVALWWNQSKCVDIINRAKAEKPVREDLELLEKNSLSMIVDPKTKKTLLDKLLCNKDPRILEAIRNKHVSSPEIQEFLDIKLETIDPQSYKLLHECLLARCIYQRFTDGVFDILTTELVNKESLFMGPGTLEYSIQCDLSIFAIQDMIWRLVKEDEIWAKAEEAAKKVDHERILPLLVKRRKILIDKEEIGFSRLHVAVLENDPEMIEYLVKNRIVDVDEGYKKGGTALSLSYYIHHERCSQALENVIKYLKEVDKQDRSTE